MQKSFCKIDGNRHDITILAHFSPPYLAISHRIYKNHLVEIKNCNFSCIYLTNSDLCNCFKSFCFSRFDYSGTLQDVYRRHLVHQSFLLQFDQVNKKVSKISSTLSALSMVIIRLGGA